MNCDKKTASHAHESWKLLVPMAPLAVGAVVAGYVLKDMAHLEWWQGSIVINHAHSGLHNAHSTPPFFKFLPLLLIIPAVYVAWWLFAVRRDVAKRIAEVADLPYAISLNKWYIDELYTFVWVRPTALLSGFLARVVDAKIIDGVVNGAANTVQGNATWLRGFQTGYVYHYALAMVVGLVCLLLAVMRG